MLILTVVIIIISKTECRVFCEDTNAAPWMALGYGCPINCHNILNAINKLRMMDYEYFLKNNEFNTAMSKSTRGLELHLKLHLENHWEDFNGTRSLRKLNHNKVRDKYENDIRHLVKEYVKIFENNKFSIDLKAQLKKIYYERIKCSNLTKKVFKVKKILHEKLKRCSSSRRYDSLNDYLYKIITDILNKHTTTFKFTINMTKILLKKILGPNLDLRNGFLDVNKILQYLRNLLAHLEPQDEKPTIKLKTKHCFNLYVSGCYCKPGFIENSGRCVTPKKCNMDSIQASYLPRIVLY